MTEPAFKSTVYLSFAAADLTRAKEMRRMLADIGVEAIWLGRTGTGKPKIGELRIVLARANSVFVLVGPRTRMNKWVDTEIDLACQSAPSGPSPALIAVILPEHGDYSKPFYDPDHVPLRLHENIVREAALLRKWPKHAEEMRLWIQDSLQQSRRVYPAPFLNFAAQATLSAFPWDEEEDLEIPEPAS